MLKVKFYGVDEIEEQKLKYAVITARYEGKWIVVKHKNSKTWEIPGGHKENFEEVKDTASRELFEETGANEFELKPVCIYSVSRDKSDESFGKLYHAEIKNFGDLPESEIKEVKLVDELPEELTYPKIQPQLFNKVLNVI